MARSPSRTPHSPDDTLGSYRAKRDFTKTLEPSGSPVRAAGHRFIVQKHAATRLHYDFRLELDGVLKSWAVTRGPSPDPADKRLAVRTEDHPLDYASFEGTIPERQYGGGTVMLWDSGIWTPIAGKDPRKSLEGGHLHFTLDGQRMHGEWVLVRLKPRGREKAENWLLRKVEDGYAGASDDLVGPYLTSVETGRTMNEITDGKPASTGKPRRSSARPGKHEMPSFHPLQLATLVDAVPTGNGWLHEMKYDGYRVLLAIGGGEARAYTRSGLDWSDRFAPIVRDARRLPAVTALIDGEAVVFDAEGCTNFQRLQNAMKGEAERIDYVAFDLLELDGEAVTDRPLIERKDRLHALIGDGIGHLRYSDHVRGHGEKLFTSACAAGLEGIVSKRADSRYAGSRNGSWRKIKCVKRQEFLILGWTPSDKARGFRSLLLGVHENGALRYAGKVGTGFDASDFDGLLRRMKPLARKTPTVTVPPAATRGAHWIRPALVAEIAYTEMTRDGTLRHPSFLGLREDKDAKVVVLETPATPDTPSKPRRAPASHIRISHPERVIDPESGITKGQLADYYAAIAPIMLPWASDRPISLVRCPQGRAKKCFFQKHDAGSFGTAVHHIPIREADGSEEPYLYIDDTDGLLSCVQMGSIEFHGWGARIENIETPDRLVFDLDPDEGLDFEAVRSAAQHVRDLLAEAGLETFPMTTGGKGIHVIAPLTPQAEWLLVKDFARRFATALAQSEPDRFTSALSKSRRTKRIFIDYLRNQRGATAVMPYSARARPRCPVAVPLTWEELRTLDAPSRWTINDVDQLLERASTRGLAHWGRADQQLPDL